MDSQQVRQASHAGSWYSNNKVALSKQLDDNLNQATNGKNDAYKRIKSIIGPHAGFDYSGPTAAWAYSYLGSQEKIRVFLLGPCHHTYIKGVGLSELDQYETPLGNIPLDKETIAIVSKELKKLCLFTNKEIEEQEHSLEMHLPYIYKQFPNCKLVPIMVGATTPEMEAEIGKTLAKYYDDPSTIFVISSDFCHWGKRFQYSPYEKEAGEIHQYISKLDHQGIDYIVSHNYAKFISYIEDTENTICGRHPIGVLLNIIKNSKLTLKSVLTKYNQSSQVTKPNDSSVSYASIITFQDE